MNVDLYIGQGRFESQRRKSPYKSLGDSATVSNPYERGPRRCFRSGATVHHPSRLAKSTHSLIWVRPAMGIYIEALRYQFPSSSATGKQPPRRCHSHAPSFSTSTALRLSRTARHISTSSPSVLFNSRSGPSWGLAINNRRFLTIRNDWTIWNNLNLKL